MKLESLQKLPLQQELKVGYLFSRYPVPSQTFCDTEISALEATGVEIEIYACSPPATSFRHGTDEHPCGPVFYAPPGAALEWSETFARQSGGWPAAMVSDHATRYGEQYDPVRRARHAVYFAGLLRRRGIEHLHVHFANRATHAALFIHALTGLPFSFTAHAQDFLVDLGSDDLLREMCAKAAFVVTVSDWSRRELGRRCPEAEAKIHRIYNGLSLDRWPGPTRWLSPPEPRVGLRIFSVGRLVAFKGFGDLIAACAELRARGVPFQCEIAGEGPLRATLTAQIERLGVQDCVRLAGLLPQGEIRARMAACDVFALACCLDAAGACDVLPTVILEAMAAGKPVVSTTLAGVPEMVEDGKTGRLVAPSDVRALADALEDVGRDPARRERFGQAGRRKLETTFSSAMNTRELASLFARYCRKAELPPTSFHGELTCLFDRWPNKNANGMDDALLACHGHTLGCRLVALTAGASQHVTNAPSAWTHAMLPLVDFLPDAMVLEGEWRECAADAHRIEIWRGKFGGGAGETDEFLLAARRALYLHRHWRGGGQLAMTHLHAVGPQALRCACILKWLGAVRALSFFLAPGEVSEAGISGTTLRRLGSEFASGWIVGERKLASALGPNFQGGAAPGSAADWQRWLEAMRDSRPPSPSEI